MQLIKSLFSRLKTDNFKNVEKALCFFIFISLLFTLIIYTLKKSIFFTSIPIDGAFQHINPLRRIAAGEIPGRDFQVFHGLVISYLHYPIYFLFGKTLFASEVSRYFINGLCAFFAILAIFGGLRRPVIALGLSAFFIISTELLSLFWLTDPFGDAYSSLAVRTLVPALCLGYLFYINRKQRIRKNSTFSQIVIPLTIFCSSAMIIATEQEIALFLATASALILIHPGQPKWYIRIRDAVLFCLLTPLLYLAAIYVITGGKPSQAISFYLSDLPADQFWYFGAYPNIFPKDFSSLFFVPGTRRPFVNYIIITIAIFTAVLSLFKSKNEIEKNEYRIWMLGLAYGCAALISNLGMISSHYSEAATRIACAVIISFSWTRIENRLTERSIVRFRILSLLGMAIFVLLSPAGLRGLIPSAVAFNRDYSASILEKRYSGVIPTGEEYKNLSYIASTVIPPKSLLAAQANDVNLDVQEPSNFLIFHNPPVDLVTLISKGTDITINNHTEQVEQVTSSHLLLTYSGRDKIFTFRYDNPKLDSQRMSSTPFYSKKTGIWINGISSVSTKGQSCLMIGDPKLLSNITRYRIAQFLNESFERHIISTYNSIICVDGPPLEPYVHGFPQQLVIKSAIEFTSKDFQLTTNSNLSTKFPINAEWLYHAEQNNKNQEYRQTNEQAFGTKVSSTTSARTKKTESPASGSGIYFETWTPASCEYDKRPTIWSTYTGFFELESGTVNQSGIDYIIHALGKKRRANYIEIFESSKPAFVHTIRPTYTAYERWIQTASWPFYEAILANYDLVRKTDYSLIWRRKSNLSALGNWVDNPDSLCQPKFHNWVYPSSSWDGEMKIAKNSKLINLDSLTVNKYDKSQVYVLEVDYVIDNKLSKIPVFGKVARYFISPIGTSTPLPVSLPPYETKIIFPLIIKPGEIPALKLETSSIFGNAEFSISSIRYRKITKNVDAYKAAILDQ